MGYGPFFGGKALPPDGIVRVFYVSKSQLYAVCRQATGSSVWEYIIIKRLRAPAFVEILRALN